MTVQSPPEAWRPIPGFEGIYDASDLGRIRSWKWKRPHVLKDRPIRTGYLVASLSPTPGAKPIEVAVHRLVMLTFVGPRPDGLEIRHRDGNPANNALSNLSYGTHSENMLDKVAHGTHHEAAKTHCPAGHAYDEANTRIESGSRKCRACNNARNKAARAANPDLYRARDRSNYAARSAS